MVINEYIYSYVCVFQCFTSLLGQHELLDVKLLLVSPVGSLSNCFSIYIFIVGSVLALTLMDKMIIAYLMAIMEL